MGFKGGVEIMCQLRNNSDDIILSDLLYGIAQSKWDSVVAAILVRRNFIAIEKNEDVKLFKEEEVDYVEIIKQRLNHRGLNLILQKRMKFFHMF